MRGEYQWNPFWHPRRPLRPFLGISFLFIFFSKSFTPLITNRNRSNSVNRLSLTADEICIGGDDFGLKFSYAPIWWRECWGVGCSYPTFPRNWARKLRFDMYIHTFLGALNVPFGGLDFSAPLHPFTIPNMGFFGWFFLFLEFVSRITPAQIGLGS